MELDKAGIEHEINFWREFVKSDRFTKDWCSAVKTNELNDTVYMFLQEHFTHEDTILDVGSGPVSLLHGSTEAAVSTADPLSSLYQEIVDFQNLGINPPENCPAELVHELGREFSCVHISNALDHAKDPEQALRSLMACVKPGGYLIVQNHTHEATHEKWQGFHQHDLSLDGNDLLIVGKGDKYTVVHPTEDDGKVIMSELQTLNTGRTWMIWILKKKAE